MSKVNVGMVKTAFEDMVNQGRDVKIQLGEHTTPAQALARMTEEDFKKLDVLGLYKGISANSYAVQASALWTSLFWKIGEQILVAGSYISPFEKFFKPLEVGGDVEEVAPRVKAGLDRPSLANSALFTNYVTQYDSFYHRINQFKVFASTYERTEIEKISTSWANIANMLDVELENIQKSMSFFIHQLAKDSIATQYLSGGMHTVTLPAIIDANTAATAAVTVNRVIKDFTIEPSGLYIPYNLNSAVSGTITDVATSKIWLVATSELVGNMEFRNALNTYFQGSRSNDAFDLNVIEVSSFPTAVSPTIAVTPGYTAPGSPAALKGIVVEENAFIYRMNRIGTFDFNNAATLKTSVFQHLDAFANISDRRKVVALV